MNHYGIKHILIALSVTSVFFTVWFAGMYPKAFEYIDLVYTSLEENISSVKNNIAAVLLHQPVTVAELQTKYSTPERKVRVLIVPGHEPNFGGTEFGNLKEREMNVELAKYLGEFLKNNDHYDVMLARDNADWSPTFTKYFKDNWESIVAFLRDNRNETLHLIEVGKVIKATDKIYHNKARSDVALRLYGINKWENENAIDIAIHIHFNDYPRKNVSSSGKYSGFTIYIPERQYANNPTTKAVADKVFLRLAKYNGVSNLPIEDDGVVEEQDLIAIGAYNTTNSASMLIEYGYIYEPQFASEDVRHRTLKDLAFQTYLGLQDFFGSGNDVSFAYDTLMLPHEWRSEMTKSNNTTEDVLALQSALLVDGVYPGEGNTKNDCPRTGRIGPCTLGAIESFQKKYDIRGERGKVGEQTRKILNDRYSVRRI